MGRSRSSDPYPGAGHLPLIRNVRVPSPALGGGSTRPPAWVLAAVIALVVALMWGLTAGAESPDSDVAAPDGSRPAPLPAEAYLMPLFATIDGAIAHETEPLWAAWIESGGDGGPYLYVAAASGLSPADVAVIRVAAMSVDERITAWGDDGIAVQGADGARLIPLPAGLPSTSSGG